MKLAAVDQRSDVVDGGVDAFNEASGERVGDEFAAAGDAALIDVAVALTPPRSLTRA